MSKYAISVENVSKQYQIGQREPYRTLRDALVETWMAPFRRLRHLTDFSKPAAQSTFWALKDVSFQVQPGDVIGIIGPNGAGKSTLLKILSRITEPTLGRARLRGRVGSLLEVGTGFNGELTGRDNIYLNGAILGMKRREIERKFDEIVAFSELETFIDTPVKRYSSGMYMRLAFSVAAHLEPEILIIDEVLAVGDAAFQRKSLGKMQDVSSEGRTVLFVSHNMPIINRLCNRAILIDQGRVVADGETLSVTAAYLNRVSESGGGRDWNLESAPGNRRLKLLSAKVLQNGIPTSVTQVSESLSVQLEYMLFEPDLFFRCAVLLYTQGVCAFSTVEPAEASRPQPGRYTSTVIIPPDLLVEGEYAISIFVFATMDSRLHYVKVKEAVVFQVVDTRPDAASRNEHAYKLPGLVRPPLAWEMSFVS